MPPGTPSSTSWLPFAWIIAGWGFAWAFGQSVVSYIDPVPGWLISGIAGGLVTAIALRLARPSLRLGRRLAVIVGWTAGGAAAAALITYDAWKGWIVMSLLGGVVTALTVVRAKRSAVVVAAWVIGGLIGTTVGAYLARALGPVTGGILGGRSFLLIWAAAWAIAGHITGAVGGAVLLWQVNDSRVRTPES